MHVLASYSFYWFDSSLTNRPPKMRKANSSFFLIHFCLKYITNSRQDMDKNNKTPTGYFFVHRVEEMDSTII
jgi:hypothetical protein